MASNSLASFSSSCSVSRARGLSIVVVMTSLRSEFDFDVALGGVDADADVAAGRFGDLSGTQVAHLARLHGSGAGVADPDAAAEGELEAGLLTRFENRRAAITFGGGVAVQER